MPYSPASLTKCCRLFSSKRLSVGWAIALGITVVSTITRSTLAARGSPIRRPVSIVTISIVSTPSPPMRFRHRVRLDGSIGASVWNQVSPVKCCQYGVPTQVLAAAKPEQP